MEAIAPRKLDTSGLKKFAQAARRALIEQVSTKLKQVLAESSAARREQPQAVKELDGQIADFGQQQVIERVAYTWFNRFSALRFMDANGYTNIRVVSPAEGQTRPEILAEAAAGHVDEDVPEATRQKVSALLEGRFPSQDPQGESYRLLLVAACNGWHAVMPFLFEKIADYTELLMPDDLLSANSILAQMRDVMTEDTCRDVEIIGWLYQFYISEKKDEVFAGLKKNKKITPENIPAATQLFTPHWIVRYLVENSLGRLWMLNRPSSKLRERMDYYIAPETPEDDFLRISSPEEIKVCDPACGSGHMLTYAFDLLYAMYEEEGYDTSEIPALILRKNLYGIEIDERAGALAAFALTMKARGVQRRFFRKDVKPNVCVLENVSFEPGELAEYTAAVGRDLFTADLRETLGQFVEADNFGSLIVPKLRAVSEVSRVIAGKHFEDNLFLRDVHARVRAVLRMADYLSQNYHVVVANPPYMGGKGMNGRLGAWAQSEYKGFNTDLFSMFIIRIGGLVKANGFSGLMTPFTWMFISSFEALRVLITRTMHISSLVRPEYHAFFDSAYVPICAFTLSHSHAPDSKGVFVDLGAFVGADKQPIKFLEAINARQCEWKFHASSRDFWKVPGTPIAYWLSDEALGVFEQNKMLSEFAHPRQGLITGDNDRFLRFWSECGQDQICVTASSREDAKLSSKRWYPHHKGGAFRKWYGNHEYVVDWEDDGQRIRNFVDSNGKLRSRPQNLDYYFKSAVTWTSLTVGSFNARICYGGFIYDAKGPMAKPLDRNDLYLLLGVLNSSPSNFFLKLLAPTMDYNQGPVGKLPWPREVATVRSQSGPGLKRLVEMARNDWDSYETSWDFSSSPLLSHKHPQSSLSEVYDRLRSHWRGITEEMQRLEKENNRIFIDAYGLHDELIPDVPLEEITLTCNPAYRYGGKKSQAELEDLLRADAMREFVSYAVGCMFGRYSIDAPGLILANQGEGIEDYLKRVPEPTFSPDRDNVIPILDGDWFADDIADRFRRFLRVTFGEERFAENLAFMENALGKDIRRYFLRDFYDDHVRRYRKRPIYWMFSSPKGSFNALIYMHRYRPDTISVVLNDYLREYRRKLAAHRAELETISISGDASQSEKTKALKGIESLGLVIEELDAYERDVLYTLATQRIEIDLDDGVKVNYARFGGALKPIKGLNDTDD